MDFFSLPHQNQPVVTDGEDGATDLFAKAVDERYNTVTGAPVALNNSRVTPLSLSLPQIPRNSQFPSPHLPTRPHPHHLPAPSPSASLFTAVVPADLPEIFSDPQTLILDIRPLPAYDASRIPHAVPLSVPSTLLKRPLFSTSKLAEMLPNRVARRKFSQWRLAKRILVYDTDSTVLPDNSNILGLLRKFRAEAGAGPQQSGAAGPSNELHLSWIKGGFQAVLREQAFLLDSSQATDDDDDEDTPSPPSFPDSDYLGSAEHSDPTDASSRQGTLSMSTNRPTLLRTKHLPMSAFTVSSTTSQRSGSAHHKLYQAAARDLNPTSGPVPSSRTDVAYNPFYDTIRQNVELSHGITERIPLRISQIAKNRIDELPFLWLRELGRWAGADEDASDAEDHFEGMSGSGMSGEDHSDSSSDSGDDSGSGREYAGGYDHTDPPAPAPAIFPTNVSAMMLDDPQAEGSEALAMQFYRIELGEQRRLMGIMEHHSRESGRVMEGETKGSKSKKRSKLRSKGMGRSSRGKHGSREFPYSITAGVEKGAKNRYRNIWPFEHARVRLQKKQRSIGKLPIPPSDSNPGTLHPLTLPQPADFLPPVTLSLSSSRSIQLPLNTPAIPSSTDDYVNASFVQPLGTKKRYIATQGPLPETVQRLLVVLWEQNVHVIVMLTREVEGSTVKCGNYWSGENFGPLRLKLLEVTGAVDEYEKSDRRASGEPSFPFMYRDRTGPAESNFGNGAGNSRRSTVKRVLELSHTGFSHLPPRRIVQFQYLDWPDLNVPSETRGVLDLIREVEREVEISEEARGVWEGPRRPDDWRGRAMIGTVRPRGTTVRNSRDVSPSGTGSGSSGSGASSPSLDAIDSDSGITKHALGERPVLLHCSAGVGRTGGFIAIDAVLDGVRREMRKRREGLQVVENRGERDSIERTGHTSGSSTSEKDRSSSSDEVAAMDVDEASAGGSAPPVPGLVMKLAVEDRKAVLHVPVVGVISPAGREGKRSYATPYGPRLNKPRSYVSVDSHRPEQAADLDSQESPIRASFLSIFDFCPGITTCHCIWRLGHFCSSSKPFLVLCPQSDSARSDVSVLSLPVSLQSFSPPAGPERSLAFSATAPQASGVPWSSASSSVVLPPALMPAAKIVRPVAKRASGSSVPPDTEVTSDSSRGHSTGPSSLLSCTKSGSPDTLPTDPSVMDLSSATKPDLENSGLRLPIFSGKNTGSPPGNEESPPNNSDPYYSQSHSQSEQHSPPAFDYTRPRRLHDDRHSPILLSTLDEPIHRVIEDMREQRMSLCQSLRQYVFVHRAVIEGVLILMDEERKLYGRTWKDTDLEEFSKLVSARLPTAPAEPATTSESGSGPTGSMRSGSSGREEGKSSMGVSSSQGKRRASPTELPKEDRRGDMRMSKRPSIKRVQRSSDDSSCDGAIGAARRTGNGGQTLPPMR
ncbi:hypothetical protein EDB92DRAFT_1991275 [Lactarius akahatsu]|uniref:protein-tyrosine-phosphatase n=1 Tax=Lactarius akahatsu TaxID=416441 RepID=A0AAD4LG33_9AGAM|nr:hypothetical protein EDB92DRAFT_1991275 [Lactarius akahatsu]